MNSSPILAHVAFVAMLGAITALGFGIKRYAPRLIAKPKGGLWCLLRLAVLAWTYVFWGGVALGVVAMCLTDSLRW